MFYLRSYRIKARGPGGKVFTRTIHIYWNYRRTRQGIVDTDVRSRAKTAISNLYPEAEFYR